MKLMEMTFRQYIDNPMGKRNAVFSKREIFRAAYVDKFDKILLREAGKINFTLYIDKKKDRYIAHIKIPSETIQSFYYDAVILFYTNDPAVKASSSLQDYYVKFFSNDPAFVFVYLNVFLTNNLLFEDLKERSSKQALKNKPNITNPYGIPGYSKVLYFAYLYMNSKSLFSKSMYKSYAVDYNKKQLLDNVEHSDIKVSNRIKAAENLRTDEKKAKKETKVQTIARNNKRYIDSPNIKYTKNSNTVGSTRITKTSGITKYSKRAKHN